MALDACILNWCALDGGAGFTDGGTGACGTLDTCISCVQTGTGKTQSNGMCTATQNGPPLNDPACGQCVDQLIACDNDDGVYFPDLAVSVDLADAGDGGTTD